MSTVAIVGLGYVGLRLAVAFGPLRAASISVGNHMTRAK